MPPSLLSRGGRTISPSEAPSMPLEATSTSTTFAKGRKFSADAFVVVRCFVTEITAAAPALCCTYRFFRRPLQRNRANNGRYFPLRKIRIPCEVSGTGAIDAVTRNSRRRCAIETTSNRVTRGRTATCKRELT